ncbi:DUF2971 domain-containing protein [Pseudomonas sp. ANT_J12]|uniref:DUF2971 domain-containing protein n=2 Tax=Pseudomonas TaxID=286 RepID=A0A2U2D027_9PSED|nr:DUF2971 domain-containing protein [Pseudomonas sp. ANT_J12]PWE38601.1 hypothetical protein C9I49_27745 [Pseudomonas prosekii]
MRAHMEKYVYRFRSIDRLLGEEAKGDCPAKPGELEKLHIYFSPPSQLNDPLEGYREIYWSGDKIVWLNLFRHYLLTLAIRSWQVDGEVYGEDVPPDLVVHVSPETLEGEHRVAFDAMDKLLCSDGMIDGFVSALAKRRRKCFKPELLSYLQWLHWYILSIVFEVNHQHNLSSMSYPERPFDPGEWQRISTGIIKGIGKRLTKSQKTEAHASIAVSAAAYRINSSLIGDPKYVEYNQLITTFPPRYCESIERLMYPDWYVACFMEDASNSSIWGTYGENHTGICLKYKVSGAADNINLELYGSAGLGNKGISQTYQGMTFQKVHYNREHVEINFFTSLGNISQEKTEFWYQGVEGEYSSAGQWFLSDGHKYRDRHWKRFDLALTTKLAQWRAEQEYRIILKSHIDLSAPKDRLLKYKFKNLDGLIFGIKTPLKDKLRAIDIIKDHCRNAERKSFNFYQAYYDPETKTIGHGLLDVSMYWAGFGQTA